MVSVRAWTLERQYRTGDGGEREPTAMFAIRGTLDGAGEINVLEAAPTLDLLESMIGPETSADDYEAVQRLLAQAGRQRW